MGATSTALLSSGVVTTPLLLGIVRTGSVIVDTTFVRLATKLWTVIPVANVKQKRLIILDRDNCSKHNLLKKTVEKSKIKILLTSLDCQGVILMSTPNEKKFYLYTFCLA